MNFYTIDVDKRDKSKFFNESNSYLRGGGFSGGGGGGGGGVQPDFL